jgi:hypothetical protein
MKTLAGIIFIFIISLLSCTDSPIGKNAPDVSHIDLDDVSLIRYDKLVEAMDTNDIEASYKSLMDQHPEITDLYFNKLLNFSAEAKDSFYIYIKDFITAEPITSLQKTVDLKYPNIKSQKSDFNKAQKYLKYYFPEYVMPNFYTYITEFGYQTIIFSDGDKDGIGIGLDMYLGSDFDYKQVDPKNPIFSDYLTSTYNENYIVRNAIEIIISDLMGPQKGKRMLDQMLYKGKRLYLTEQILPWVADSIIMEYTTEDIKWVEDNELQIWDYFLENNLIYETNHLQINKFLNPSPNSPGMPPAAPGRTATYIGWQIVRSYMQRNPETTLQELISLSESQKLLELSRYKPKRR